MDVIPLLSTYCPVHSYIPTITFTLSNLCFLLPTRLSFLVRLFKIIFLFCFSMFLYLSLFLYLNFSLCLCLCLSICPCICLCLSVSLSLSLSFSLSLPLSLLLPFCLFNSDNKCTKSQFNLFWSSVNNYCCI